MEAIFHLVFTIFKLAALGCVYATVSIVVFNLIDKFKPNRVSKLIVEHQRKSWFSIGFVFSVLLVLYSTTHWGSHGYGDSARIPLNEGRSVSQIDGTYAYLNDVGSDSIAVGIDKFAITSDYVLGITELSSYDDPIDFFAWNLATNELMRFNSSQFANFIVNNNLPEPEEYKSFWHHYDEYWSGWRFWMLL